MVETNNKTYYRDASSGAIINKRDDEYKRIVAAREQSRRLRNIVEVNDELKERLFAVEQELKVLKEHVARLNEKYHV